MPAPTASCLDQIVGPTLEMPRFANLGEHLAFHRVTGLDQLGIGLHRVHAAARVGGERQVTGANQDLAVGGPRGEVSLDTPTKR